MTDKYIQKEEEILSFEVSDEVLEAAATRNGKGENFTLSFCSTPWTCPMSALASAT